MLFKREVFQAEAKTSCLADNAKLAEPRTFAQVNNYYRVNIIFLPCMP